LIFAFTMAFAATCAQYVEVVVTNRCDKPIRQIRIAYTGGTINIPILSPKASRTCRVQASGDSSLALRFIDAHGQQRSKDGIGYFGPGFKGSIAIDILPDARIVVRNNMRP